ncbi:hypothetical protein [Streptomyces sp. YKOK-I1]
MVLPRIRPISSEEERAALSLFDEGQLGAIILEISLTNFFNRINRTIREQAGKSW